MKAGRQFELVVADVVREMDPNAKVTRSVWIKGPDGARELDVLVEGTVAGNPRRIHIECRDYNPKRRPIGIEQIDALESKHRDLNVDVSLLCSNAGFTEEAIRKATRSKIGLVAVLKQNDPRIRYRVCDEVYVRRVEIVPNSCKIEIHGVQQSQLNNILVEEWTFDGKPIFHWLRGRILEFLAHNPIVNGSHSLSFRFNQPVLLDIPAGNCSVSGLGIGFEICGQWVTQIVGVDATSGLYDWVKQTVRTGNKAGEIVYKDVKIGEGGKPIRCPPNFDPAAPRAPGDGAVAISIVDIGGFNPPQNAPALEHLINADDLNPVRPNLPQESYYSW
jgi:hypothetical protein